MVKYFWLIWFLPVVAFSQEKATFSFDNKPISEVLFSLEKSYNVRFSYSDELLENKKITIHKKQKTLKEILKEIEEKTTLKFERISKRYLIVKNKKEDLKSLQNLKEIVLDNYLTKGISKNKKGFYTIKPKQLEILPGLIESDVLESIQQLPGVVSVNETATGLVVRGGTSDQNRIIWDGINIYHNGHLFGMISAFNPSVSQKIKFHNKGTNPRFGERVSSVIDIKTNTQITNKLKASIGVNGISADAFIEIPVIAKKMSLQLSARRSYADLYQTPTFNKIADKVFQTTKIEHTENTTNEFYFTDYNIKLNYILNKNNSIAFSSIFINNQLDYLVKDNNKAINYNDLLKIKNEGYALDWNKKWTNKISQKTAASFSKYKLNYNFIKTKTDGIGRNQISDFDKRNIIFDTNIFTEIKIKTTNKSYIIGYQYSFKDVSYAFLDTSDLSFVLDFDENEITTHSLYNNYSHKNEKFINLEAGFRLNYYKELDKIKLEPRLLIYKNLTDKLKLQLTGEVKNQVISQIDETVLSNLSIENRLWRLADGKTFPIINSNQISAGILYSSNGWSFDVDHYYKNIKGVTALSLGFLNPDGKTFRIGKQKVMGVDFYTKKDFKNFKTWVSYSYTNVKSKFTDLNKDAYFTANTSITHAVSTSIAYKLKKFQIALGWKWRTGKPFTKSILSNNQIQFDGINTERLPNYHRLDFSTTYQLNLSKKNNLKGKIGLSIRNIYNQKNQLSREYTGFNNLNDPIEVADKFSLGFTPNFLFKVYW